MLRPLCELGKLLSQHCKSCCTNRLWSSPRIPSPKESFFFSASAHGNFQARNLGPIQLSLTAIFSWPVSGEYLSKPCRHVGGFCFGVFHTPLSQSNPTCYAQTEDLAFAECFSQGKKTHTEPALQPFISTQRFLELVHSGAKWGGQISLCRCASIPAGWRCSGYIWREDFACSDCK